MKVLTREEEAEHYSATVRGGIQGGLIGLAGGTGLVYLASRRYPAFRSLTLQLKAFLASSAGTFVAITSADSASRNWELERNPNQKGYTDSSAAAAEAGRAQGSTFERARKWGKANRYNILGGGWAVSMAGTFAYLQRSRYLTMAQKLVQARVAAQGLTVALILGTAAFEIGDAGSGEGRYETVKVLDPNDPKHKKLVEKRVHHESYQGEDQWMDMVAAEEERLKEREDKVKDAGNRIQKPKAQKKKGNGDQKGDSGDSKGKDKPTEKNKGKAEETK
ncbi:MAG: hypothetical protein M1814_005966 [Vezdaea aestivalis]|nr:MAG: hypothetical protein M1814_005966 [Vezdaea aestivalis]